MKKRNLWIISFLLVLAICLPGVSGAALYSLQGDWSDAINPNNTWTYRQGTTALPLQTDYDRNHVYVTGQHAWANAQFDLTQYGNNLGHVPVWMKASVDNALGADVKAGDVMIHPTANVGISALPLGEGNVIWTSPINGTVTITGNTWWGGYPGRGVEWRLYLNATGLTTGTVYDGSGNDRDHRMDFGSYTRTVHVGDTVMFEAVSAPGVLPWFVGVNLSIDARPAPVPIPPSALLLAPGLAGLAAIRRRFQK